MTDPSPQAMVYCVYCGKPIPPGTEVVEQGLEFCNTLCRYAWRNERGSVQRTGTTAGSHVVREEGIDLVMDIPAPLFKGRGLSVRSNFWKGLSLMVDGKPLKRLNRKHFNWHWHYRAQDNAGTVVDVYLHITPYDPVPKAEVHGVTYTLSRPWKWHEYLWVFFPLILGAVGGAIGGFFGGLAAVTNGRLFRTQPTTFRKYFFSLLALLSAVSLYFAVVIAVLPFIEEMSLRQTFKNSDLAQQRGVPSRAVLLSSKVWTLKEFRTEAGRTDDEQLEPLKNLKRYFMADGKFSEIYRRGGKRSGFWRFDPADTWIVVRIDTTEYKAELVELTASTLRLRVKGLEMVHNAD